MSTLTFEPGGYHFVKGVFQYSAGVAAVPGHRIVRVRFLDPVPLEEGFRRIEQIIGAAGRPLTAFCACELRSPAPFTEDGFTRLQQGLCRHAGALANLRRHDQSGGAQQCLPGDRPAR